MKLQGNTIRDDQENGDSKILTKFDRELFHERLQQVPQSYGYEPLLHTWQTYARYLDPVRGEAEVNILPEQQHKIIEVVNKIKNSGIRSVVIEAAHSYLYEDLEDPRFKASVASQASHASALTQSLLAEGIGVHQVLFLDDYNPDPVDNIRRQRLDIDLLIQEVNVHGFSPEVLLWESAMEPVAKAMIEAMGQHPGMLKHESSSPEISSSSVGVAIADERTLLSYRNIELYRQSEQMVSCAMLDAALSVIKLRFMAEGICNVLPRRAEGQGFGYKSQQQKMRTILTEHLGVRAAPVFNIFTGDTPLDRITAGAHHDFRKPH